MVIKCHRIACEMSMTNITVISLLTRLSLLPPFLSLPPSRCLPLSSFQHRRCCWTVGLCPTAVRSWVLQILPPLRSLRYCVPPLWGLFVVVGGSAVLWQLTGFFSWVSIGFGLTEVAVGAAVAACWWWFFGPLFAPPLVVASDGGGSWCSWAVAAAAKSCLNG